VVFSSNDYLGLAQHPDVRAAWKGAGAGSSRLIAGDRPAHHALETALSERFGRPATLFNTGYTANLALLSALVGPGELVASDALNHASIIDGIRLSGAEKVIVPHGERPPASCRLAVVEGLYSMDGDTLDLHTYAGEHWLAVDDAHAVGALGPDGRGEAARQGVTPDFLVGTLGKAYGAFGAFVIGPPELRELFVSRGRTFIYTTALPEPVAAAALAGLRLADDERRERLADRTTRFRNGLAQLGRETLGSAHVVPVVLGERTMAVADELLARGFFALGIRPPTVPAGTERIRFSLSAEHTDEQIDRLLEALDGLDL
jgi:8-amino-7-oxononanoate synthase